jgi:hypothetical protein
VVAPLGVALSVDETPALWAAMDELSESLGEWQGGFYQLTVHV